MAVGTWPTFIEPRSTWTNPEIGECQRLLMTPRRHTLWRFNHRARRLDRMKKAVQAKLKCAFTKPAVLLSASLPCRLLANNAMAAIAANTAPARNVAGGLSEFHREPAMTLANSSAAPLTRLNIPKPVPRKSAGAVSPEIKISK